MPAAAAEAGAFWGAGGTGAGALLQADTAHLQPVHHEVRPLAPLGIILLFLHAQQCVSSGGCNVPHVHLNIEQLRVQGLHASVFYGLTVVVCCWCLLVLAGTRT
jgi:hypothetical protein